MLSGTDAPERTVVELSVGFTAYLRAPDGSVIETWTLRLIDENRVWVRD